MIDQNAPKIMVVEDEISVSMELQEMLTENGYDVPGVTDSGEEAVTMARSLDNIKESQILTCREFHAFHMV